MGYKSTGYGTLQLSRPLVWSEFKDSRFADPQVDTILWFPVAQWSEETDRGVLQVCVVREVGWRYEDACKMYSIESEIDELAKWLPEDVSVSGWLMRIGEESPDIERYTVRNRCAVVQKAEVRWPDGSAFSYG